MSPKTTSGTPLYSAQYEDVYFSKDGGLAETKHVFLDGCELPQRWVGKQRYCIAETGFGTGLNLLSAAKLFQQTAKPDQILDLVSVELNPLSAETVRAALSEWTENLVPFVDRLVDNYPLETPGYHRIWLAPNICLTLIYADATQAYQQLITSVDSWFLDGFSPAKNPDMWTPDLFTAMAHLSHANTNLASFTVAASVRNGLQQAGFAVEKRAGFGRKRHCLVGKYVGKATANITHTSKSVRIHGGGLAGAATAYSLARLGIKSAIIDPAPQLGASQVQRAILNLRLLSPLNPVSEFYLAGYDYAQRLILSTGLSTVLQTAGLTLASAPSFDQLNTNRLKMNLPASVCTPAPLTHSPLLNLPDSDRQTLAFPNNLICSPQDIIRYFHTICTGLSADCTAADADIDIHCTGIAAAQSHPDLALKSLRGQVDFYTPTPETTNLNACLQFGGYLTPTMDGTQMLGATYDRGDAGSDVRLSSTQALREKAAQALGTDLFTGLSPVSSWAGVRAQTPDHYPYIGEVAANTWVNTGHGSHGLTSALFGAEIIASQIFGLTCPISRNALAAICPNRFKTK